jgi:hypothetical protein
MPAPTYNCPFSAAAATSKTCAAILAENTNASCPLYDGVDEQCMLRQRLLYDRELWRGEQA